MLVSQNFKSKLINRFSPTSLFLIPTFFYFITERALSYTFPIITQRIVQSNFLVGLIMSVSAIVSLGCDIYLPQVLKSRTWKIQLIAGIVTCMFFPMLILAGETLNSAFMLFIASFFWAISYEVFSFSQQNFITEEVERKDFTKSWGSMFVVTQLVSIAGLFFGPSLIEMNQSVMCVLILAIQAIGLVSAFLLTSKRHKQKQSFLAEEAPATHVKRKVNIMKEVKYWFVFTKRLPGVVLMGFWLGVVDAAFWTYGGLLGESLNLKGLESSIIIVLYIVPSLFGAIILSKFRIEHRKKWLSQVALILSGIFLSLITLHFVSIEIFLLAIFLFGFAFAFTKPLNDAVYSDLIDRTEEKDREHLLGLAKANDTFSYLIGPIAIGWLIDQSSYLSVFAGLSVITSIIAIFLLLTTPRKIKLPRKELGQIS